MSAYAISAPSKMPRGTKQRATGRNQTVLLSGDEPVIDIATALATMMPAMKKGKQNTVNANLTGHFNGWGIRGLTQQVNRLGAATDAGRDDQAPPATSPC